MASTGHEIAPNVVTNATKFSLVFCAGDQDSKIICQVGDQNSLGFVYLTLMYFATK